MSDGPTAVGEQNGPEDGGLFATAAPYYAHYRPGYDSSVFSFLRRRFALDGTGLLVDLGCGTGQMAVELAADFEDVLAVDVEAAMIAEGMRVGNAAGIPNVAWLVSRAEDVNLPPHVRLTTIGAAFHWMDRDLVLDRLFEATLANGGVAIIDVRRATSEPEWVTEIDRLRADVFGPALDYHPDVPYELTLAKSRFERSERHELPRYRREFTLDEVIGQTYATPPYTIDRTDAGQRETFERRARRQLLALHPSGVFAEDMYTAVLIGQKTGPAAPAPRAS